MSGCGDSGLDAVERRLAGRAGRAAPPGHRDRVLAAVRDTLAGRGAPTPPGLDAGCRAALVAMALSASLVIVAPWVAVARSAAPGSTEHPRAAQARTAGIELPVAAVAATSGPACEAPSHSAVPDLRDRRHDAWRMRQLLQGEL